MTDFNRKQVVVPVLSSASAPSMSVESLMGQLQRVVKNARDDNPDLLSYRLYDVALRMEQGELKAVLDFRL